MNGKAEGQGEFYWPNGELYSGQWVNGMKHGVGEWQGLNGGRYVGQWLFGKVEGNGEFISEIGDHYSGSFENNMKHGYGEERFANGDHYKGQYQNGKPEGQGEYRWQKGSVFKGEFKNGLRHGRGYWQSSEKEQHDSFEGEYVNDKKCGYGIFKWASGNVYKGNYFNDLRQGFGEMQYNNRVIISQRIWNNGTIYRGQWDRGIQHGLGELNRDNTKKEGIFKQNQLIEQIAEQEEDEWDSIQDKQNPQIQPMGSKVARVGGVRHVDKALPYRLMNYQHKLIQKYKEQGSKFSTEPRSIINTLKQRARSITQSKNDRDRGEQWSNRSSQQPKKQHIDRGFYSESNDFSYLDHKVDEILGKVTLTQTRPWIPSGKIKRSNEYNI